MTQWRGTQRWIRVGMLSAFGAAWLCYLAVLLVTALSAGLFLCIAVAATAVLLRKPVRPFVGDVYAPT
jgi:hypothetical protein